MNTLWNLSLRSRVTHLILFLACTNLMQTNAVSQKTQLEGVSMEMQLIKNAQKYLLGPEEKQSLVSRIQRQEERYDPDVHLIKSYARETGNRYHSDLVGVWVHPIRTSISYAGILLDSGDPGYRDRAFEVIRVVLESQDRDEARKTYGIWPYNWEEPLDKMKKPDWNWADFVGVQLLEIYMMHGDRLPADLKSEVEQSIIHASRSIQRRDVRPGYTNIAVMGTLVTYLCAHLFDLLDMKEYADMRMTRFYDYTRELGGFAEYNSPNYTLTALNELMRMKQYILDPKVLKKVDYCYYVGWEILSSHFHPTSGQLAGPHSRSYSTLLRGRFHRLLNQASESKIPYVDTRRTGTRRRRSYSGTRHRIPEDLVPNFVSISTARVEVDTLKGARPAILVCRAQIAVML